MSTHECPVPGCQSRVGRKLAFCREHWFGLPYVVRQQIWRSYRDNDIYTHVEYLVALGARIDAGTGDWPEPD